MRQCATHGHDFRQALRAAWLRQVDRRPTLPVTAHTAAAFGVLAAAVKQAGRSPGPRYNDLWIAAQAIEYGHILLTLNAKGFSGLPGLLVTTLELKPSGQVWAPERRCLELAGLKGVTI